MSTYFEQGRYRGRINAQGFTEASTGNPQFFITFDVLGVYDPASPEGPRPTKQGTRTIFRAITDATIDYLLEDLKSLGYDKQSFAFLDPGQHEHHSFVGQEIDAICTHKEHNGAMNEKWSLSRGGGQLNVKPVDSTAIRRLDALFGAKLKANASSSKKPAPQPVASRGEAPWDGGQGDDDIKF